jgi:ABC-type polysaccharide/polyol phosphate export permease
VSAPASAVEPIDARRNAPSRVYWNRAGDIVHLRDELRDLVAYRDLLWSLVHRDLTVRYKRSPLGFLWTMLHPLILMTIFAVIFGAFFRFQIPNFTVYFLAPYIAWTFYDQTVVQSMSSIAWNGALMKRVRVPRSIFVVASTISGLVNLALSLIPLLIIMAVVGAPIRWTLLFLPVAFVIMALFTLGTSLALSSLSIYFADVREMYRAASPAVMYLTPMIYPLSIIPAKYLWMIKLNPLVYLLQLFRAPIYYAIFPTAMTVFVAGLAAILALVVGWIIFRHLAPGFHSHF